jgi:hypothetical protein
VIIPRITQKHLEGLNAVLEVARPTDFDIIVATTHPGTPLPEECLLYSFAADLYTILDSMQREPDVKWTQVNDYASTLEYLNDDALKALDLHKDDNLCAWVTPTMLAGNTSHLKWVAHQLGILGYRVQDMGKV